MTKNKSVLIAMSGGVDSSVAAGLLVRDGFTVRGVYMRLGQSRRPEGAARDEADAQTVADKLGIGLEVVDYREQMKGIIRYFIDEYRQARTPNPCCICNQRLKFG
ncbi:MAG: tRNA 2-thiouridine(34) synthase MnmA, partial [Sedimentisphaerales bacterium]|nr:tRNA 2-thiouridine(34) synthase MnmA [Sedimentisphaerales bacterium]